MKIVIKFIIGEKVYDLRLVSLTVIVIHKLLVIEGRIWLLLSTQCKILIKIIKNNNNNAINELFIICYFDYETTTIVDSAVYAKYYDKIEFRNSRRDFFAFASALGQLIGGSCFWKIWKFLKRSSALFFYTKSVERKIRRE